MIAYYFPPVGGGSVQRTLKYVKYLPCYGWQPIVLTVKNPDFDYFDESLLADLPENTVIRRTFAINFWRYYRIRQYGKNSLYEIDNKDKGKINNSLNPFGIIMRMIKGFINNILFIPDEYNSWIPFALWEGLKIIRRERINLIYATGNPWTSFVIAKYLSAISKIPFVVDFRDPWVLSAYSGTENRKGLKYSISKKIEKSCVTKASLVINVNKNITNIFKECYWNENKAKFITITHGFDSDDFVGIKSREHSKFIISHIGTFYSHRKPDRLLEAINYLFKTNPNLRKKIEIRFIGIVGSFAEEIIIDNDLSDVVKIMPYCSHKESINEMCNSHLLVLIQANVKGKKAETSTGKIYEYLASGRKIMALTSKYNEAVQIIKINDAGVAIEPDNIKLIAETILEIYRKWKNGKGIERANKNLSVYERKYLTGILAKYFDRIC